MFFYYYYIFVFGLHALNLYFILSTIISVIDYYMEKWFCRWPEFLYLVYSLVTEFITEQKQFVYCTISPLTSLTCVLCNY